MTGKEPDNCTSDVEEIVDEFLESGRISKDDIPFGRDALFQIINEAELEERTIILWTLFALWKAKNEGSQLPNSKISGLIKILREVFKEWNDMVEGFEFESIELFCQPYLYFDFNEMHYDSHSDNNFTYKPGWYDLANFNYYTEYPSGTGFDIEKDQSLYMKHIGKLRKNLFVLSKLYVMTQTIILTRKAFQITCKKR